MKKALLISIGAALALSACTSDKSANSQANTDSQGAVAGPLPEPANAAAASSTPAPTASPAPDNGSQPATSTTAAASSPNSSNSSAVTQTSTNYPKGIPVPGKKGFVRSPYAEYAGLVDVQGFPSGTVVQCPFTKKYFVVP